MQKQIIQSPAQPGAPYVVTQVPAGTPTTVNELRALRTKRTELSDQIQNVTSRRRSLAEQLKSADPAARKGLEDRLRVLDDRIVRMEQELDRSGELLTNVPPELLAAERTEEANTRMNPQDMFNRISGDIVPIVAILTVFVFAPFTFTVSRFIWRRASNLRPPPASDLETQRRLDQLQEAVDTIAIEVERISEGQRYVTRMMSDTARPALGAGPADPVAAPARAPAPAKRSQAADSR